MKKTYLKIADKPDGKIFITALDGIFSYGATLDNRKSFIDYCDQRIDMWLNSDLGNFNGWSKKQRKFVANKWEEAKQLEEGEYNYYFSSEDIGNIFREEVYKLAKSFNVKINTLDYETLESKN